MRGSLAAALIGSAILLLAIGGAGVAIARHVTAEDDPDAAAALAAALALFGAVPLADCQNNNPQQKVCIQPSSTNPGTPSRGVAGFSYSTPEGPGGAFVVMSRTPAGDWGYWFGTQQAVYHRLDLPGPMIVCADGDGLKLRAAPSTDAEVLEVLLDMSTVTAEEFVLTNPGTVQPLLSGDGWYRVSAPQPGWVAALYVSVPDIDAQIGRPPCDLAATLRGAR